MFQLTHKGACRTATSAPKPNTLLKVQALPKASGENQLLSLGPEDCDPSVEPEDFGKGGVELEPKDFGKGGMELAPEDFERRGVGVEPEDPGKGGAEWK